MSALAATRSIWTAKISTLMSFKVSLPTVFSYLLPRNSPLQVNAVAFLEGGGILGEFVEDEDVMPFGAALAVASVIGPSSGGCNAEGDGMIGALLFGVGIRDAP